MRKRRRRSWTGPALAGWLLLGILAACGGRPRPTTPDESADLVRATGGMGGPWLRGTVPVTPAVGGTQWRWLEAHCTEGPLDLAAQGFQQQLRVEADAEGLLLAMDHVWERPEACVQTVMMRAVPGSDPEGEWTLRTEALQALPPGCGVQADEERAGHVRLRGRQLEVLVQRSRWCNGYDLRMVYAAEPNTPLADDQLVRHFAAHFSRRDALRLSRLFGVQGELVEPFTPSSAGSTRHSGRAEVHAWFAQAFAPVPWVALRLLQADRAEEPGQWNATWEYMDPRLEEPVAGRSGFTVGGGEILRVTLELTGAPKERAGDGQGAR